MSKPKDDLISRDAAIEELMGWVDHEHEMIHWTGIKAMLECLPGVDAVPVQEPRVMTLEEIRSALKMPLWKETKRVHKDLYNGWVLAYDIQKGLGITGTRLGMSEPSGRVVWYSLDDYGKTWRCWISCPSDAQREAANWDE